MTHLISRIGLASFSCIALALTACTSGDGDENSSSSANDNTSHPVAGNSALAGSGNSTRYSNGYVLSGKSIYNANGELSLQTKCNWIASERRLRCDYINPYQIQGMQSVYQFNSKGRLESDWFEVNGKTHNEIGEYLYENEKLVQMSRRYTLTNTAPTDESEPPQTLPAEKISIFKFEWKGDELVGYSYHEGDYPLSQDAIFKPAVLNGSNGRLDTAEFNHFPLGLWRYGFYYDEQGRLESVTTYTWNSESETWSPSFKDTSEYDNSGNIAGLTTSKADGSVAARTEYTWEPTSDIVENHSLSLGIILH